MKWAALAAGAAVLGFGVGAVTALPRDGAPAERSSVAALGASTTKALLRPVTTEATRVAAPLRPSTACRRAEDDESDSAGEDASSADECRADDENENENESSEESGDDGRSDQAGDEQDGENENGD